MSEILTEEEVRILTKAITLCHQAQGIKLYDATKASTDLVDWVAEIRVYWGLAQMILDGELVARIVNGELVDICKVEVAEEAIRTGNPPPRD